MIWTYYVNGLNLGHRQMLPVPDLQAKQPCTVRLRRNSLHEAYCNSLAWPNSFVLFLLCCQSFLYFSHPFSVAPFEESQHTLVSRTLLWRSGTEPMWSPQQPSLLWFQIRFRYTVYICIRYIYIYTVHLYTTLNLPCLDVNSVSTRFFWFCYAHAGSPSLDVGTMQSSCIWARARHQQLSNANAA